MVVLHLTGGLGNQLFQYALGRYLSLKLESELVIDDSFYRDLPRDVTPRQYDLDNFNVCARLASEAERRYYKRYTHRAIRFIRKFVPIPGRFQYVREPLDRLMLDVRHLRGDILLDGFWQSDRYFQGIEETLRTELHPRFDWSEHDLAIADKIQQSRAVSLHVRRGDYVTNAKTAAWHGTCGLDYYEKAILYIRQHVEAPHFFLFSDDHDWVREHLRLGDACTSVDHNSGQDAAHDLLLMASCQHHIIANSSFSWWGAWLNPSQHKIVVRPGVWLRQLPHMNESVCPQDWVKVSA